MGWETHVGCQGIPEAARYIDHTIDLPFQKSMFSPANFFAAREIRKAIKAEHYDLIITHTSLAAFFTRLAVKGMRNRPRLVNVVHGYLFDDNTSFLKRQILLAAERITAAETDLLLVMNEWDYQAARKYRLSGKIEKIPGMGVDFSRLDKATDEDGKELRKALGIPENACVLIYPAEFSKRKSQHVLIEALQYLPKNIWLVLCGEGALLSACKALTEKLQLQDRVLFPGQVKDIAPWYRMADALAASSRSEGLPFNMMEAVYCRLPVIASSVKGHTDLLKNSTTSLLYPYGDVKRCAEKIRELLSRSLKVSDANDVLNPDMTPYSCSVVIPYNMRLYLNEQ